jgi:PAS domain-containing protein
MEAPDEAGLIGWLASLLPFGIILLDGERKIVFVNPYAERMLAANDGLGVSGGRLATDRRSDDARIGRLIAASAGEASAANGATSGFLGLHRPSGKHTPTACSWRPHHDPIESRSSQPPSRCSSATRSTPPPWPPRRYDISSDSPTPRPRSRASSSPA